MFLCIMLVAISMENFYRVELTVTYGSFPNIY